MMMAAISVKAALKTLILMALASHVICIPMSSDVKAVHLLHRHRRDALNEPRHVDCVDMTGHEGDYWHVSAGNDAVCGLYVIGDVDTIVQLEITDFDVSCDDNGLLAVVDGWELQGELFPSPDDVEGGMEAQYRTFCGATAPPSLFTASQNVALVQFRVPRAGQGFRVRVRFLRNPEPCNVLAPFDATAFTLRNFGSRRNCTTHIVFPVNVLLINADVRATSRLGRMRREVSGLSVNCKGSAGTDMVAFMFGTGLDTAYLDTRMAFCGRRSKAARHAVTLGCSNSALRLTSSGVYHNSVTVEVSSPSADQLDTFMLRHPHCAAF
ncbi:corticotropin-releasing factor-binding protein-like [Littorina saxatilis]|uniref:corticotropin-releasing factor-binding protein-like n=1 Tax=Littorina saxatilis TaxID=31220 RepID=UPI0038B58FCF